LRRKLESVPVILFEDDYEGEHTLVPQYDVAAYAKRATSRAEDVRDAWPAATDMSSGIRPSFPTIPHEVGPLVNEPEEDTLLRLLGGGDRELRVRVPLASVIEHSLEPMHGYVLGLLDGGTSITDVLDISTLRRVETLRAIEALAQLGIVA